jgi:hypothetical protein
MSVGVGVGLGQGWRERGQIGVGEAIEDKQFDVHHVRPEAGVARSLLEAVAVFKVEHGLEVLSVYG